MTWQFNPERGDITDPDVPESECHFTYHETYAYYGGDVIAETVSSKNGPLLTAAKKMYAVLKSMESVDDDPMSGGDPRRALLLAAIAEAEGRQ